MTDDHSAGAVLRKRHEACGSGHPTGIYRLLDPAGSCYFARLSGFGGDSSSIIANGNTSDPEIVAILASDAGFDSERCGTWRMDLSRITASTTTFPGGTYIVGVDIEPGQYRNDGSGSCYWARLSNFEQSGIKGILANNNVSGETIVQILPTDQGFTSARCGTWSKIG